MNDGTIGTIRYLSRADVERLAIPFEKVENAVRRAFFEKGHGRIESPPKRGVVPRAGSSIRAMKAYIPSLGLAGVKWIGAYPDNTALGLPTITGLMIVNDVNTGLPRAVMDCTWITATRTAASSAVAATFLARPESESIGIVACGQQGRSNLRALARHFELRRARCYDILPAAARKFAEEMSAELDIDITPVDDILDAARDLDIVVTSLPIEQDPVPPIPADVLAEGSTALLLDFDAALDGDGIRQCDRFFTDDLKQAAFFKEIGYLRHTPEPDGDLGKVVAGRLLGRTSPEQRVATMNMGIGLLDIATAALILEEAERQGVGAELAL